MDTEIRCLIEPEVADATPKHKVRSGQRLTSTLDDVRLCSLRIDFDNQGTNDHLHKVIQRAGLNLDGCPLPDSSKYSRPDCFDHFESLGPRRFGQVIAHVFIVLVNRFCFDIIGGSDQLLDFLDRLLWFARQHAREQEFDKVTKGIRFSSELFEFVATLRSELLNFKYMLQKFAYAFPYVLAKLVYPIE